MEGHITVAAQLYDVQQLSVENNDAEKRKGGQTLQCGKRRREDER